MKPFELSQNTCVIVGEVAQAHDGSLGTAHRFIDVIADAGADAVKFQTHIAAAESTPSEPFRVHFSKQDQTRYDYWKRMEFTETQWLGLAQHAQERGLFFLSSPFSMEAVDLLERVGVPAWKIASGEVSNQSMLDAILQTKKPVILSSGMSPLEELDRAVGAVREAGQSVCVLQCTSSYPCPPEKIGLNLLSELHGRYRCPVGLSDHSGTIFPGLAGAAQGMAMLEIHVTLSPHMFGPDVSSSVTVEEFQQLVNGIRFIETMNANPIDKNLMATSMAPLRDLFTKSVVARHPIAKGTFIQPEDLAVKKPGTGIPEKDFERVVGLVAKRDLATDELFSFQDLESPSQAKDVS